MLHNKKAQIGETMTWIIATMVIIVILVISIFIVSVLAKGKGFGGDDKKFEFEKGRDLFVTKSLSGYLLTQDGFGVKVFEQLNEENNLNDFNGLFAKKIFSFYEKEYSGVWLGVSKERCDSLGCYKANDYFEEKHREYLDFIGADFSCSTSIKLKDKNLILFLNK